MHDDGRLCVLPRDSAHSDHQHHDVGVHVPIRHRVWLESVGVRHCLARPVCMCVWLEPVPGGMETF